MYEESLDMPVSKIILGVVVFIVGVVAVGWLGTRVKPDSFEVPVMESRDYGQVERPTDLPVPVARYVDAAFGAEMPIIESALTVGQADLTFMGVTFPARFKFYYGAGDAYYHFIQLAWFGQPIVTVNEQYKDGVAILDLPGNLVENEEKNNSAANLGLWAESIWLPSIFFTDERVHWEPIDDTTARLIIPAKTDQTDELIVYFDPQTALITKITAMRYQDANATDRTLWTNHIVEWRNVNGVMLPVVAETQWGDDAPWAIWRIESVLYNVDVSGRLAQFGGDYKD
jgi:hypothetical protein